MNPKASEPTTAFTTSKQKQYISPAAPVDHESRSLAQTPKLELETLNKAEHADLRSVEMGSL